MNTIYPHYRESKINQGTLRHFHCSLGNFSIINDNAIHSRIRVYNKIGLEQLTCPLPRAESRAIMQAIISSGEEE